MATTVGYLQRLASHGVAFRSFTEEHLSTENELVRNILLATLASLAKLEREKISQRTKAGLERARVKGKVLGKPKLARSRSTHDCWDTSQREMPGNRGPQKSDMDESSHPACRLASPVERFSKTLTPLSSRTIVTSGPPCHSLAYWVPSLSLLGTPDDALLSALLAALDGRYHRCRRDLPTIPRFKGQHPCLIGRRARAHRHTRSRRHAVTVGRAAQYLRRVPRIRTCRSRSSFCR
jgi:hypothetical protein